jgi:hypothetical protein
MKIFHAALDFTGKNPELNLYPVLKTNQENKNANFGVHKEHRMKQS